MVEVVEKGQEGALTLSDLAANTDDLAVRELLASVEPEPAIPGLVTDQADDFDVLGKLAENINAKRRARGRPVGAANKRNDEMFDYLEARGFKAPELRMMEIVSADPRELAAALSGAGGKPDNMSFDKVLDVVRLQLAAARDLLPYKFAKKHEIKGEVKHLHGHVMIAGRLTEQGKGQAVEFSLTGETE